MRGERGTEKEMGEERGGQNEGWGGGGGQRERHTHTHR